MHIMILYNVATKNMKVLAYSDKKNIKKAISGKKIVLVGGCFDILHFGHIKFLEKAKKYGNFLVVILESDKFIKQNKNKESFHNVNERAAILSAIRYVDLVIKIPLFKGDDDYFKMTKFISPKFIAVSKNDKVYKNKLKQSREVGGKLVVVTSVINKFSSSKALKYASIFGN